jgi:hypothetical protein
MSPFTSNPWKIETKFVKLQQARTRPLRGLASMPECVAHCVGSLATMGGGTPDNTLRLSF